MSKDDLLRLLQKYYNDNCSPKEIRRLNQYLADKGTDGDFLISAMDELLQDAKLHRDYDKETVLLNIKRELGLKKGSPIPPRRNLTHTSKNNKKIRFLIAACLVTMMAAAFLIYGKYSAKDSPLTFSGKQLQETTTRRGQFSTINLPDGSTIRLNVASGIRFSENFLDQPIRKVYLQGEAFFDVASIPEKPFIIESGGIETEVTGTSFNISAYPEEAKVCVSVVSGKVAVGTLNGSHKVKLASDEMATCDQKGIEKSSYDSELVLGWASQTLVFKNAGFEEVIKKLEDWYDVDFVIKGEITSSDYTARHKAEPLEVILKGLSFAGNFSFSIEGKKVLIHANPK